MQSILAMVELQRCSLAAGMDGRGAPYQALASKSVTNIVRTIAGTKLNIGEATTLIKAVTDSQAYTAEQTAQLAEAATANATSGADGEDGGFKSPRMQTHDHMHSYLTEADWQQLGDNTLSLDVKARVLAKRAVLLGLTNPSEGTVAQMIGIVFAAHGSDTPTGDVALNHLRGLKRIIKQLPRTPTSSANFPADPQQFHVQFPMQYAGAYAKGPPVPCPSGIEVTELRVIQNLVPRRSTNASCNVKGRAVRPYVSAAPAPAFSQEFLSACTNHPF